MAQEKTSYPDKPGKIWREHHYVIITGSSHSDGYGGSSGHLEYQQFRDREEWECVINRLEQERGYPKDYVALEVFPAVVQRTVTVAVKNA